jgi:hypothetical protein
MVVQNKPLNEVAAQLYTVHNPFADTTNAPKLPDGQCAESLGIREQIVQELSTNYQETDHAVLHLLLMPHRAIPLMYVSSQSAQVSPAIANFVRVQNNDLFEYRAGSWNARSAVVPYPSTDLFLDTTTAYSRIISQGLQLKLLNTEQEDDGWWEAVRVYEQLDTDMYSLHQSDNEPYIDGPSAYNDLSFLPVEILDQLRSSSNLPKQRSYSTGLLKELENVQFNLNVLKDTNDFHQHTRQLHMPSGWGEVTTLVPQGNNRGVNLQNGAVDNVLPAIRNQMSDAFDMVYIRIHGRAAGTAGVATRLHANLIQNIEVIHQRNDDRSRYHTRSHNIGTEGTSFHLNLSQDENAARVIP